MFEFINLLFNDSEADCFERRTFELTVNVCYFISYVVIRESIYIKYFAG